MTQVISKDEFRAVMGSFASGVTIVTTVDEASRPWGMTVSAFSSLSLDPPLGLVCIDKRSASLAALKATERFCVNILSEAQQELSGRFASRLDDKFADLAWDKGLITGCPLFPGALAWMECRVHSILPGGDHEIVVGLLEKVQINEGRPLVYYRGGYGLR